MACYNNRLGIVYCYTIFWIGKVTKLSLTPDINAGVCWRLNQYRMHSVCVSVRTVVLRVPVKAAHTVHSLLRLGEGHAWESTHIGSRRYRSHRSGRQLSRTGSDHLLLALTWTSDSVTKSSYLERQIKHVNTPAWAVG